VNFAGPDLAPPLTSVCSFDTLVHLSHRVESSLHDHEQHSFGVPLTYVTWDCSVKDVIPGALAVYCEGTPAGQ
jgi:hypothetical protein